MFSKGFTLIELLVVVTIIGILAAFAYPSYMEYVKRTKREDVKSEMLRIAQELQSYRVINHTYATAILENDATPLERDFPTSNPLYTIELVPTAQTYTLTAMPKTGTTQDGSGVICIDHQGHKYWSRTVSTTVSCLAALSTTSSWDGR